MAAQDRGRAEDEIFLADLLLAQNKVSIIIETIKHNCRFQINLTLFMFLLLQGKETQRQTSH